MIPETDLRRAIGDAPPALLDTLKGDERNVPGLASGERLAHLVGPFGPGRRW